MIDGSGYIVQADTSVLNLPVEKMDYYVPGWATHGDNYDGEWRWLMALLQVQMNGGDDKRFHFLTDSCQSNM